MTPKALALSPVPSPAAPSKSSLLFCFTHRGHPQSSETISGCGLLIGLLCESRREFKMLGCNRCNQGYTGPQSRGRVTQQWARQNISALTCYLISCPFLQATGLLQSATGQSLCLTQNKKIYCISACNTVLFKP